MQNVQKSRADKNKYGSLIQKVSFKKKSCSD